jgi:hypothetical protein
MEFGRRDPRGFLSLRGSLPERDSDASEATPSGSFVIGRKNFIHSKDQTASLIVEPRRFAANISWTVN